jgi:excinuclease UvrABC helicase subunit UvrB
MWGEEKTNIPNHASPRDHACRDPRHRQGRVPPLLGSLIQTIGRAARHLEGRAILCADKMSDFNTQVDLDTYVAKLETEMRESAKQFEFERATTLRDQIKDLRAK